MGEGGRGGDKRTREGQEGNSGFRGGDINKVKEEKEILKKGSG